MLFAAGCSQIVGETPSEPGVDDDPRPSTETSDDVETRNCVLFTGHNNTVDTGSLAGDALALAGETFLCADDVVVARNDDFGSIAAAAQLAAALQGPLLFPEPRLAAELGRLDPKRVHTVGVADLSAPGDAVLVAHDIPGAITTTAEALRTTQRADPGNDTTDVIVEAILAIRERDRVSGPPATASSTTTTLPSANAEDIAALVTRLAAATESESIWLVDGSKPETLLLASAYGRSVGATVTPFDDRDLLGNTALSAALRGRTPDSIRFVGPEPDATQWELNLLLSGTQLPGGGFYVLPKDQPRRYVAFYGHPTTDALGVLGEQGPQQTLERMEPFLEAYTGDGAQVIPSFEIIASVASAGATDDGDYSFEWPADTFQPWVDLARDNEAYIILDLQSGRDDFLSQAVQYEELLKLPFVGLALDPEWRLAPDEVHLRQVGSVEAAEVNIVTNWLADLVRDNGLPQKMLIVHQFRTDMIQNRGDLVSRPEIQMVIQMDGDGTEPQKDATWTTLQRGAEDAHWAWGWKNFFDEDEPGPPSPESTMDKVPSPVYVSYQ